MVRCVATRRSGLDLRCCARRYVALLHAAVCWACGPALLRSTRSDVTLHCYTLQCAGSALLCPTRSDGTLRCYTLHCCSGLGLRCWIAWYIALLHAAVGWACAAACDGIAWYIALLRCEVHAAKSWACADARGGIVWYVALLRGVVHSAKGLACADARGGIAWCVDLLYAHCVVEGGLLPAGPLRAWPCSTSLMPWLKLCPVAMSVGAAQLLR